MPLGYVCTTVASGIWPHPLGPFRYSGRGMASKLCLWSVRLGNDKRSFFGTGPHRDQIKCTYRTYFSSTERLSSSVSTSQLLNINFHFPSRPVLQDGQPTELRGGQLLLPPADGGIAQDLVHPRPGRTDRGGGGAEGNVATAQRRPAHDARDQARRQSSLRLGLRVSLLGLALHDTRAHGLARELGGRSGWAAGEQRGPQNHHGSTSMPRCFPSARCSVGSARTFCTGIYVQDGRTKRKKLHQHLFLPLSLTLLAFPSL